MQAYQPLLVTLDYVRLNRTLNDAETTRDDLLMDYIAEASAQLQAACMRVFMPYLATKKFGPAFVWTASDLKLRDDLLEVTTLTNASGAAIASGYALAPDNLYPKTAITLDSAAGLSWQYPYRESRVEVAGIWGCVPHWGACWRDSSVNVPGAGLTNSATTMALTAGAGVNFEVGQYIRLGGDSTDEIALITGITTSVGSDTLTITRGELGTTPAAHTSTDDIYCFEQRADIKAAARELAVYGYLHKDQIGSRVQIIADGVITVDDLSPQVQATIDRYRFKSMPLAV